jgi:adenylate kinase
MFIVLLGPPGAGKGTQAVAVAEQLGVPHVSSGDLFREAKAKGTELGNLAKSYIDKGELVPDDITVSMVMERLSKPDCANGAVLDGFPRTVAQAERLDRALASMDRSVGTVLLIDVPDEEVIRRLSGRMICRNCAATFHKYSKPPKKAGVCDVCGGELYQRSDDTVETARNRLKVYKEETAPLINYYSKAGKLVSVNGNQPIEAVQKDLLAALKTSKKA